MFHRSMTLIGAGALAFALTASAIQAADAIPANVAAAVADPARPDADRQRDADRKPAELVQFAGIKAGDKVGEIMPGGGYFTRVFSKAVGDKGVVYGLVPSRAPDAPANAPDFAASVRALATQYPNVRVGSLDPGTKSPEPLDVVWTSLNYHDFHNRPNADLLAFNKMVLDSLKPGGVYIVVDHAAEAGSGKRDTSTLHRIDPALVKTEVTAAGFEYVGESTALRNPQDPHTASVRDQTVRGKTDQLALKFRKPAK